MLCPYETFKGVRHPGKVPNSGPSGPGVGARPALL